MKSSISSRRGYFLLQVAAARTRGLADDAFGATGRITTAQAAALAVIVGDPGCSQRTVATTLQQRESGVTVMIRRLVDAGLVERDASSTDRRAWALWPTDEGRAALDQATSALASVNRVLAAAIGPENIEIFLDCLESLCALGREDQAERRHDGSP